MAFFKKVTLKLQNTRSKELIKVINNSYICKYLENVFHGKTYSWRHELFITGSSLMYPTLKKINLAYPPIAGFRSAHLHALTTYFHTHVTKTDSIMNPKEFQYIETVFIPDSLELLLEEIFGVPESFAIFYMNRCCIQSEGSFYFFCCRET